MDITFMGTPAFAVQILDALCQSPEHRITAVFTQPPRPGNRGKLTFSDVYHYAEKRGLHVFSPESLKAENAEAVFADTRPDVAIVAAYGLLLPEAILRIPKYGCINVHASLLPRWRGAAPVQRAILAGDAETGVTIMQMERGLDTGPMLAHRACTIAGETTGELTQELGALGAALLLQTLENLQTLTPIPQPETGATYAAKIQKEEAQISWQGAATEIARLVRAMQPAPGAWFMDGKARIKLVAATAPPPEIAAQHLRQHQDAHPGTLLSGGLVVCGEGVLQLETVKPGGRKAMPADAWLHGRRHEGPLA